VACGCYPLAPSKYVISNRNAAEGSPNGTHPSFRRRANAGACGSRKALAADDQQDQTVAVLVLDESGSEASVLVVHISSTDLAGDS
jgi:hypothetical protein